MADIRINSLSTTASSTASDDFVAVDGTTNGTRKLNAYSPTFGGNATVSGTLTVNGTSTSAFAGPVTISKAQAAAYTNLTIQNGNASGYSQLNMISGPNTASINYAPGVFFKISIPSADSFQVSTNNITALTLTSAQQVQVNATTASTSTSSGALVVSGGVGVAGNAYIGGDLVVPGQNKAINAQGYFLFKGAYCNIFSRGTSGGWGTGLVFHSSNTDPSASIVHDPTSGDLTLYTNATASNYASTDRALLINTSKQVQVLASTASTSTSTGALVVSGGVGVAGVVYSGGFFGNAVDVSSTPVTYASSGGCVMSYSGSGVGVIRPYANGSGTGTSSLQLRPSGTLAVTVSASTVELAGGIDLKLGNAYTAGAPTATGYIVIKDSTGTSYKIPAQAL